MTDHEIFTAAIRANGETYQENIAIEECSELIQALCHKHRGRPNNVAEEIADVEICLEQLKIINNCSDEVKRIHRQKVERLYAQVYDEIL